MRNSVFLGLAAGLVAFGPISLAGSLCDQLLAHLQQNHPSSRRGAHVQQPGAQEQLVDSILEAILELANADYGQAKTAQAKRVALNLRLFGNSQITRRVAQPYHALVANEGGDRTFHVVGQVDDPGDSRFVLALPNTGETVYALLSPKMRLDLVAALAAEFRNGKYDHKMRGSAAEKQRIIEAFDDAESVSPQGVSIRAGLVPLRVLGSAVEGADEVGVCRHAACALVGLLAELGYPSSVVRIVSGSNESGTVRHRWLEVWDEIGNRWQEFDPSFRTLAEASGESRLFSALGNPLEKPNAVRFPRGQKIISDFLEPRFPVR